VSIPKRLDCGPTRLTICCYGGGRQGRAPGHSKQRLAAARRCRLTRLSVVRQSTNCAQLAGVATPPWAQLLTRSVLVFGIEWRAIAALNTRPQRSVLCVQVSSPPPVPPSRGRRRRCLEQLGLPVGGVARTNVVQVAPPCQRLVAWGGLHRNLHSSESSGAACFAIHDAPGRAAIRGSVTVSTHRSVSAVTLPVSPGRSIFWHARAM
jgi:hypothetical protein